MTKSETLSSNTQNNLPRTMIIGSGTRFLSGISYYTLRLINEFALRTNASGILMRQLLPSQLYPGKDRVGKKLTQLEYDAPTFDGVDWYWLPSIFVAMYRVIKHRPNFMIFEWWTGTVLHSYILLALVGKLFSSKIIIEFHEVLDTGEAVIAPVKHYVNMTMPILIWLTDGFVVHSTYDYDLLKQHYKIDDKPVVTLPHASFDQYRSDDVKIERDAPVDTCNILFFGVIRPYKGLEDLVQAFNLIPEDQIENYWLTIVGEPWENWTLPLDLVKESPYRDRITLVDRYVNDEEVGAFFATADLVALPYHRSSSSGPLHVAMSSGLPVVVSEVGGLVEVASQYDGAILIQPNNPQNLLEGIIEATPLVGKYYEDPYSWEFTYQKYMELFSRIDPHA